jgi:hypothetical protein
VRVAPADLERLLSRAPDLAKRLGVPASDMGPQEQPTPVAPGGISAPFPAGTPWMVLEEAATAPTSSP